MYYDQNGKLGGILIKWPSINRHVYLLDNLGIAYCAWDSAYQILEFAR